LKCDGGAEAGREKAAVLTGSDAIQTEKFWCDMMIQQSQKYVFYF